MWFKNLRLYRLNESLSLSEEELNTCLKENRFKPCGKLDPLRYGWVPPLGRHGKMFTHSIAGYTMLCARRQEKILPTAVINEHLEEKVLQISTEEGRHVSRKERQGLKDEIIFTLLPQALTKSSLDFAYLATQENLLIVNTASANKAEELINALRHAIGSFKVVPLQPKSAPTQVMTRWLQKGKIGRRFELGEECELQAPKDGRVIRCKKQDLSAHEILSHIDSGMIVSKVAITWNEAIRCVIDDQFAIKRLKFEDEVLEKAKDSNPETAAEEFDLDFSVMALELSAFITQLLRCFGGEGAVIFDEE